MVTIVYPLVTEVIMGAKDQIIILRMTSKDKDRIADAAKRQGDSITYFVTQTALKEEC